MIGRGYAVPAPTAIIVGPTDRSWELRPTRLSPIDVAGVVSPAAPLTPGDALTFAIGAPGRAIGPMHGVVVRVHRAPRRPGAEAELMFTAVSLAVGRDILDLARTTSGAAALAPSPRTEEIFDLDRIDAILRGLVAARATGRVRGHDRDGPGCELELEPTSPSPVRLRFRGGAPPPPFGLDVGHFNSVFSLWVEHAVVDGDSVLIPPPSRLTRRRTRQHRRASAAPGATIHFRHPVWPALAVAGAVVDASFSGLAFHSPDLDAALFPGLEIPEVLVSWPGQAPIAAWAEVRHASLRDGHTRCGLRLIPAGADEHRRWADAVSERLYPWTVSRAPAPADLWQLYQRAGYFQLSGKDEDAFVARRTAFAAANPRLHAAAAIGCQVTWPSPRGLEAAVTLLKPYSRAWVGFQLARRQDGAAPAPPRRILREVILHGYEYPQRDPDFEWLITWVQTNGRFSRLLMRELTARFGDLRDQATIVRFRALEGTSAGPAVLPPPGVEIGPPSADELAQVLATIRLTRPWPYVAAHDLVPERFELGEVSAAWRTAGLARARDVRLARIGGRAAAVAVLELAEEGVHLYGLFDVVRLFALAPGGEAAFGPLLDEARTWYRTRGKATFVYFCEESDPAPATTRGLIELGAADMTVLAAELLPDQLEHAWEITARHAVEPEGPAR